MGFKNFEHEAPSTNRMCSKFKEANDFLKWQESDSHENGKKVTFMKWQSSDVHEMAIK